MSLHARKLSEVEVGARVYTVAAEGSGLCMLHLSVARLK